MSTEQDWTQTLRTAFPHEFERIVQTVHLHPQPNQGDLLRLFLDLAAHVPVANGASLPTKKRKLDDSTAVVSRQQRQEQQPSGVVVEPVVCFECKDVSFQVPARKKLKLQLVDDGADRLKKEIRLHNPSTSDLEYALPVAEVDQIFCLPVPEKQQRQWNFCVFPKPGAARADGSPYEQIVFTMNETKPAAGTINPESDVGKNTTDAVTQSALNRSLQPFGKRVIMPDPKKFASSITQAHRKGEKAYHVKAHRGSKEGYLFFLENGIVFGFKKPLAFFAFSSVVSVSYTSVLQRTFNLNIAVTSDQDGGDEKEVEFSMLDQADFAGIDEYVKMHDLHDASMAAQRRAKVYNVNKGKKDESNGDAPGTEDVEAPQQKTEQELQDEEDELEEDYEASGGDSDGSGAESDEDEDENYAGNDEEEGEEEEEEEEEEVEEDGGEEE